MTPRNAISQLGGVYANAPGGFKTADMSADTLVMMEPKQFTVNTTVTLTDETATITFPQIQKKCKIVGFRAITQLTHIAMQLALKNGANTLFTLGISATAGNITEAGVFPAVINPAYSTLNPGDTLSLVVDNQGDTLDEYPISCMITVVPIGNS